MKTQSDESDFDIQHDNRPGLFKNVNAIKNNKKVRGLY